VDARPPQLRRTTMALFGIPTEHKEIPMPSIVGGLDIHRKQITFDYLDLATGEVGCGQVAPVDRAHLRARLARFERPGEVAFAVEACTGWRYVTGELQRAGMEAHLAELADTAAARGCKVSLFRRTECSKLFER
jgi:hypothetical protein